MSSMWETDALSAPSVCSCQVSPCKTPTHPTEHRQPTQQASSTLRPCLTIAVLRLALWADRIGGGGGGRMRFLCMLRKSSRRVTSPHSTCPSTTGPANLFNACIRMGGRMLGGNGWLGRQLALPFQQELECRAWVIESLLPWQLLAKASGLLFLPSWSLTAKG